MGGKMQIEKDQIWVRNRDGQIIVIDAVYLATIYFFERGKQGIQSMGRNQFFQEYELSSIDDAVAEIGGIF
jgi:hypothetical protein